MKKSLSFLTLLMILTSCGPSSNSASSDSSSANTLKDIVNIRRLSADLSPNYSQARIQSASRTIHKNLKDGEDSQAVLLYDYESVFYMTITLENPKAETIDAIQLTSYDPSATVFVDGVFKPIHYDNGSRIVNWSQEDPYEKVIQISSSLNSNENFVEITDLKVNGKWQNEELHNNTLFIKRVVQNAFSFVMIHNAYNEYKFKFNFDENVSNIIVNGAIKNEDGTYSALESGLVSWTYKYNVDGVDYVKTGSKAVTLLKIVDTYNIYSSGTNTVVDGTESKLASFKHTLKFTPGNYGTSWRIWVKFIEGTDVNSEKVVLSSGGKDYEFPTQLPGYSPGYDNHYFKEEYLKDEVIIKFGGKEYKYTKDEILVPKTLDYTEDWAFDLA